MVDKNKDMKKKGTQDLKSSFSKYEEIKCLIEFINL